MNDPFLIFALVWFASVLLALFAHGIWGHRFARMDMVPPALVALFWPIGLAVLIAAAPFLAAYLSGRLVRSALKSLNRKDPK